MPDAATAAAPTLPVPSAPTRLWLVRDSVTREGSAVIVTSSGADPASSEDPLGVFSSGVSVTHVAPVPQLFPLHHLQPETCADLCKAGAAPQPALGQRMMVILDTSPRCFLPTPFIWLQLCLQILWRDVVLLLFALGRFGFTLPAAAVTAAAEAAAAVAARDDPAERKQGLQRTEDKGTLTTCAYQAVTTQSETHGKPESKNTATQRQDLLAPVWYSITEIDLKTCAKLAMVPNILHRGERCQPGLLEELYV